MLAGRICFRWPSNKSRINVFESLMSDSNTVTVFVYSVWSADHIPALPLPVFSSYSSSALLQGAPLVKHRRSLNSAGILMLQK